MDLECRVCGTHTLVWGEFRRAARSRLRVAHTAYCLRHLPDDWYTGGKDPDEDGQAIAV